MRFSNLFGHFSERCRNRTSSHIEAKQKARSAAGIEFVDCVRSIEWLTRDFASCGTDWRFGVVATKSNNQIS